MLTDPYEREAPRQITDEERSFEAYKTLRENWARARHEGARKARQAKVRLSLLLEYPLTYICRRTKKRPTRRSKVFSGGVFAVLEWYADIHAFMYYARSKYGLPLFLVPFNRD